MLGIDHRRNIWHPTKGEYKYVMLLKSTLVYHMKIYFSCLMDHCNNNWLCSFHHRFINVLIVKYCVDSSVVELNCGSDAYTIIDRMKRIILPTMNEYDVSIIAYVFLQIRIFLKFTLIRHIS